MPRQMSGTALTAEWVSAPRGLVRAVAQACDVLPLVLIIVGHLIFLTQAAVIGYGFSHQAADPIGSSVSAPNVIAAAARASTTISYEAADANGNVTTRQITVTVAHN